MSDLDVGEQFLLMRFVGFAILCVLLLHGWTFLRQLIPRVSVHLIESVFFSAAWAAFLLGVTKQIAGRASVPDWLYFVAWTAIAIHLFRNALDRERMSADK